MSRQKTFLLGLVLAALVIAWAQSRKGETSAGRGDVILVVLDTVRADALGCYGNPRDPTPHIDAIAADGIRFDHAMSPSGWTLPAVASLLTGAWPTVHGALGKRVVLTPIRDELPTAAEILSEAGFTTLGVANAAFVSPMLRLDRGFDVFDHQYAYNVGSRRADATVDTALQLLREHPDGPRFLMIHLFDAHLDYGPPGDYAMKYTDGRLDPPPPLSLQSCLGLGRNDGRDPPAPQDIDYVTALYHGEIHFMDDQIGRLVGELESMGIYDSSTLVITSDHGEEFWDHRGFEHGHTLYDELVRVPLILKPPDSFVPSQRIVEAQVRALDVMPTVFDLLEIPQPETFAGRSLLPLATGRSREDRTAFSESTLYGADRIALRTARYTYIHDLAGRSGELYDRRGDPGETRDLSADRPEVAAMLRREAIAFHDRLRAKARGMSKPQPLDMSPRRIQMLKSLGYIRE